MEPHLTLLGTPLTYMCSTSACSSRLVGPAGDALQRNPDSDIQDDVTTRLKLEAIQSSSQHQACHCPDHMRAP
jgi:hypothetical protein